MLKKILVIVTLVLLTGCSQTLNTSYSTKMSSCDVLLNQYEFELVNGIYSKDTEQDLSEYCGINVK